MGTEPVVVQACCLHCQQVRDYHPSAARLTLFANTAIILEYFCLACHGYNKQRGCDFRMTTANIGQYLPGIKDVTKVTELAAFKAPSPTSAPVTSA